MTKNSYRANKLPHRRILAKMVRADLSKTTWNDFANKTGISPQSIDISSTDRLLHMLTHHGHDVTIQISPPKEKGKGKVAVLA